MCGNFLFFPFSFFVCPKRPKDPVADNMQEPDNPRPIESIWLAVAVAGSAVSVPRPPVARIQLRTIERGLPERNAYPDRKIHETPRRVENQRGRYPDNPRTKPTPHCVRCIRQRFAVDPPVPMRQDTPNTRHRMGLSTTKKVPIPICPVCE